MEGREQPGTLAPGLGGLIQLGCGGLLGLRCPAKNKTPASGLCMGVGGSKGMGSKDVTQPSALVSGLCEWGQEQNEAPPGSQLQPDFIASLRFSLIYASVCKIRALAKILNGVCVCQCNRNRNQIPPPPNFPGLDMTLAAFPGCICMTLLGSGSRALQREQARVGGVSVIFG